MIQFVTFSSPKVEGHLIRLLSSGHVFTHHPKKVTHSQNCQVHIWPAFTCIYHIYLHWPYILPSKTSKCKLFFLKICLFASQIASSRILPGMTLKIYFFQVGLLQTIFKWWTKVHIPSKPPGMVLKALKIMGYTNPTSTGEFARFLNR